MAELLGLLADLIELAFKAVADVAERSEVPFFGLAMTTLGGGALGIVFSYFFRERLFPALLPGTTLLVSPLILGGVMHLFGRWREAHGHPTTLLATYGGGAALGFGIAGGRLLALFA